MGCGDLALGPKGRWLAFLVGICASVTGCEGHRRSGPAVSPQEFQSFTIYVDGEDRPPSELPSTPHVQVGPRRARRLFPNCRHHGRWVLGKGYYFAVARTTDGREVRLSISLYGAFFVIEGQRGWWGLEGPSATEWERIHKRAGWRVFHQGAVFEPLRRHPDPGLRPALIGGKYGYVDKAGLVVIEPRFDDVMHFSEGLAAVRVGDPDDGKWGYIDTSGRFVIEPRFAGASFFSEGLAAVTVDDFFDGKQGYVNRQGEMVIAPQFVMAWPFVEGLAVVATGDGRDGTGDTRCINPRGEVVTGRYPPYNQEPWKVASWWRP
jgi:hypothetical protein